MSFMGWESLPEEATTLAQMLADAGYHTAAAVVDTPFYWRHGMNFDRGFQTFFTVQGQEGSNTRVQGIGHHESRDVVAWWRKESDHKRGPDHDEGRRLAGTALQRGLLPVRGHVGPARAVGTRQPTTRELYMPDYDGEVVQPIYAHWQDEPGFSEAKVNKAAADL